MFLGKDVLKICSKFIGEHPCRSVISIKLQQLISINLLHIFRTPFPRNTSEWLNESYVVNIPNLYNSCIFPSEIRKENEVDSENN